VNFSNLDFPRKIQVSLIVYLICVLSSSQLVSQQHYKQRRVSHVNNGVR